MAVPLTVSETEVMDAIGTLRDESDRGAAVLAGSLVENALGSFLASYCLQRSDKKSVERLFGATGPLGSFSQRSLAAHAFGIIDARKFAQLGLIREIRNHFAHHPLSAAFTDSDVVTRVKKLPVTVFSAADPTLAAMGTYRVGYLMTCASIAARFQVMEHHVDTMFPVQPYGAA